MDISPEYGRRETSIGFPPMKYLSNIRHCSLLNSECKELDRLVGVVERLQDVVLLMGEEAFELPQIVAVGDQSCGKSSVVEGLVGWSFLPRGAGAVTRRPLLVRLEAGTGGHSVVFRHKSAVFTDWARVTREIEEETERAAGPDRGVCPDPIVMTLYTAGGRPGVKIVDLPGLVRVPMGDQPPDVEAVVRDIALRYASNPNSIILAVVSANTDIATSESLKLAREIDPHGDRTLLVVTKLDIMDSGTNATDLLTGNLIPVKLGIVGVVNRSQRDVMQGRTLREAATEEIDFFFKHYPQIAQKNGRTYLAKRLQTLLLERIHDYLPRLKTKIQNALSYQNVLLKSLHGPNIKSPNESLLYMLNTFATNYIDQVRGHCKELDMTELKGGARISYVFHEVFGSAIRLIDPLEGYSKSSILTAVRNCAGAKPSLFIPETCFELLLKKQILRLEAPALRCVQLVYDEMEKMLFSCTNNSNSDMFRFPKLSQKIIEITSQLLKSRIPETDNLVQNIIAIQGAYIYTTHPDFKRIEYDYQNNENQIVPVKEEQTAIPLVTVIERLIVKYFSIVRMEVQDMVPKAIMHCFVNYVVEHIHSELISNLYGSAPHNQELLEESIATVEQKKTVVKMIEVLKQANKVISDTNEGNFIS